MIKTSGHLVAAALSGAAALPLHAQPYGDHPHFWGGWGGWGMMLGPLMMIVFLAVAVGAVVLLVRWLGGASGPPRTPRAEGEKTPIEILEERFARGEIDEQEFRQRKRTLSES
ncbi:MAG: SHOCT domain-containing protein [Gammaproteobacteria bacterium]|nr:SHOCT domain-containing protein [Gammaproteobacteria bacterium]NIR84485.1 SHOCT domain-containing protein [Gammaproteobacteria bacterium]NIR90388.1 SHOCT domain-containing protein [Gammaproteobacteria bacterium]NIU05536.1 SHOCT domain-containing protein [Gammaproteobacteria bacterium]NIV52675.1 SHOCT domain-containing protein [Gammaproteobacteria bacterium]